MKIEYARSLDIGKNITASHADHLYAQGVIKSKYNFVCPAEGCHAQITCANLDNPIRKRKVDPYYKFTSENHKPQCPVYADIVQQKIKTKDGSDEANSRPFIFDNNEIVINFSEPSNKVSVTSDKPDKSAVKQLSVISNRPAQSESSKKASVKTLQSLIDIFLSGKNNDLIVNIGSQKLPIKDLFIEINDSYSIADLPDKPRVYFGKGWINQHKENFIVRFAHEMKIDDLMCKPSFFIPAKIVDSSSYKRTSRESLTRLATRKEKQPFFIFIYSENPPIKSKNGEHINFTLISLSRLVYRI